MSALPDDPRDCHRAICKVFGEPCFEWPQADLPMAALHMAELFQRVQASNNDEASWALDSLALILNMGQDAVAAQADAFDRVRALARHGTGDYRELDAARARRMAGDDAQEPTAGDVAAAERILKALGHSWTMQEIIACLRDAEADA